MGKVAARVPPHHCRGIASANIRVDPWPKKNCGRSEFWRAALRRSRRRVEASMEFRWVVCAGGCRRGTGKIIATLAWLLALNRFGLLQLDTRLDSRSLTSIHGSTPFSVGKIRFVNHGCSRMSSDERGCFRFVSVNLRVDPWLKFRLVVCWVLDCARLGCWSWGFADVGQAEQFGGRTISDLRRTPKKIHASPLSFRRSAVWMARLFWTG